MSLSEMKFLIAPLILIIAGFIAGYGTCYIRHGIDMWSKD